MNRRMNKKKPQKWRNRIVNIGILLLILVGLILVFNKPIRNMFISKNINHYQINKVSSETIKKNNKAKGNFNFDEVKPVSSDGIALSQLSQQYMPVIGGVAVPEVGINLPIFKGVANNNVAYGAGTMKENQVMGQGNYALASHNVTGFNSNTDLLFTPLEKAKKGMLVYVTDKENVYQYRIDKVSVLSPDHTEVIEDHEGQTEITLVTCADSKAVNRIIVHGVFEKKVSYSSKDKDMEKAFTKSYNQIL